MFKKYSIIALCAAILLCIPGCDSVQQEADLTDTFGTVVDLEAAEYFESRGTYIVDGYTYLAVSSGKAYSTMENPKLYSEDYGWDDTVNIEAPEQSDYSLATVGTEFKGLTLKEASVEYFCVYSGTENERIDIYKTDAVFEGTLTIKGYITMNSGNQDYGYGYYETGEISFCAADGEWEGLPLIWHFSFGGFQKGDFNVYAGAPNLLLGLIDDYDFDTSAIPADGSVAYVEVTIRNIHLTKAQEFFKANTAELVSVKSL